MAKSNLAYKQMLTAPGKMNDWIDATEIALDFGTFEKIKLNYKGNTMSAHYGAEDISVTIRQKNQDEVSILIECTKKDVLAWFKACVSDVVCHPENYTDYYEGAPLGDASDRKNQYGEQKSGKMIQEERNKDVWPLLTKTWVMVLAMVVLPPLGLFLFFKYHHAGIVKRIIVVVLCLCYILFIWLGFLGINTGFGLSTIKGWFTGAKQSTELMLQDQDTPTQTQPVPENDENIEYVGE